MARNWLVGDAHPMSGMDYRRAPRFPRIYASSLLSSSVQAAALPSVRKSRWCLR